MLALFLLVKRQQRTPDKILAIFLLCFSFIHIQHVLLQCGLLARVPFFDPVTGIVLCAIGPLFYFYVQTATGNPLTKRAYLHLLVLVPAVLHLLFLLATKSGADLNAYYYQDHQTSIHYTPVNILLLAGMTIYFMAYMLACVKELNRYARSIREAYSNIEQIRLDWLRDIIILLIVFSFLIAPLMLYLADANTSRLTLGYFSTFVYFIIVYKSFNSSVLFSTELIPAQPETINEEIQITERYTNSSLTDETINRYGQQIEQFLISDKLLYDDSLSLRQMGEILSIAPHVLSEVINRYFDKSFFDLINRARIEEAKKQLMNMGNLNSTIEGVGYSCGFGSKASFYRAFKKYTGVTPTAYVKQDPQQRS